MFKYTIALLAFLLLLSCQKEEYTTVSKDEVFKETIKIETNEDGSFDVILSIQELEKLSEYDESFDPVTMDLEQVSNVISHFIEDNNPEVQTNLKGNVARIIGYATIRFYDSIHFRQRLLDQHQVFSLSRSDNSPDVESKAKWRLANGSTYYNICSKSCDNTSGTANGFVSIRRAHGNLMSGACKAGVCR